MEQRPFLSSGWHKYEVADCKVKKETKRKSVFNNKLIIIIIIIILTLRTLKSQLSCGRGLDGQKGEKKGFVVCFTFTSHHLLACLEVSADLVVTSLLGLRLRPHLTRCFLICLLDRHLPSFISYITLPAGCSIRSAAFDSLLISFSL